MTGFMHNRVRLIVASFLTKDLHLNWRLGERYFAERLVDYDPCVNNGNWQWAASTGCDTQPYFRIFNPWIQQKKFDPQCKYIKRFVPELVNVPAKLIHELHKNIRPVEQDLNYPLPIVNHASESRIAMRLYASKNMTKNNGICFIWSFKLNCKTGKKNQTNWLNVKIRKSEEKLTVITN